MFRALFRLIVLLIVLVAVGGFFLGWWGGREALPDSDAVATAGKSGVEQVKRAGEEISQKTAAAAKTAGEVLSDGALTTKIKAKMGLDDTVKALDLNVDTHRRCGDGHWESAIDGRTRSRPGAGARDQRRPSGRRSDCARTEMSAGRGLLTAASPLPQDSCRNRIPDFPVVLRTGGPPSHTRGDTTRERATESREDSADRFGLLGLENTPQRHRIGTLHRARVGSRLFRYLARAPGSPPSFCA